MLQSDAREVVTLKKGKKIEVSIIQSEGPRLEAYSNLIFEIVSELGFLLPDIKYEDDPFRRKYQPSLKFRECLLDIQKLFNKFMNESLDIFDFIRCRIGEWKFMQTHFLPLLIQLVNANPGGTNEIYQLLDIICLLIFSESDDDSTTKSAFFKDLTHFNCLFKKYFSHQYVIGAITTLLASTISSQKVVELKYCIIKQVTQLLSTLLSSSDPLTSTRELTQSLSYGNNESILAAMTKSKLSSIIFSISSSIGDSSILSWEEHHTIKIFENVICVLGSIFKDLNVSELPSQNLNGKNPSQALSTQKTRKPIRHGRFSGSVSVQLSTGENVIINNSKMFASGIPGSLDVSIRKNRKLEMKMSEFSDKKKSLSSEYRSMYCKLSIEYLESHFNELFKFVCTSDIVFRSKDLLFRHILKIATYFMEFCRYFLSSSEKNDYYKSIYGMINKKFILEGIEYLHELVFAKHYQNMLKMLPFYKEMLMLLEIFSNSSSSDRKTVSKNLQKEIFHNKNSILLIKRVVSVSKPLMKYFSSIIIESNHILFKLIESYSKIHPYWYVNASSFMEHLLKEEAADEDGDGHCYGSDSNFSYETLIKLYSTRDIVDFYCFALGDCLHETISTNKKLARYFYRVLNSENSYKSVMRPSLIVQLQKAVASPAGWSLQNSDLFVVSKKIVRKFSNHVKNDPTFLIMSFFN